MQNYKVFPWSGGWMEQPAKIIRGIEFCNMVISRLHENRAKQNQEMEDKAKALQRLYRS